MLAANAGDRVFTGKFAGAVDIQRMGGIGFQVRAGFSAVEHIVGGVVNQRNIQLKCLFGQNAGRNGVDREGLLGLLCGLIDSGVSGGVDDQVGAQSLDLLANLYRLRQVELLATRHDQLTKPGKALLQSVRNLTVSAADEYFQRCVHGNRSASLRGRPFWSLAERSGEPSSCQSMTRSGSSQRMQRSAPGV